MTEQNPSQPIDPQTRIGHVHLKVSDLARSVDFYTRVLGFSVTTTLGRQAAFLSAGGYHHHIGLNTWESKGGAPPAQNTTGLYHFAILVPSRLELAKCLQRLTEHGWPLDGVADHGVSHALYLHDPDHNGIEIYCDMPKEQWPRDGKGNVEMYSRPLDLDLLMKELSHPR